MMRYLMIIWLGTLFSLPALANELTPGANEQQVICQTPDCQNQTIQNGAINLDVPTTAVENAECTAPECQPRNAVNLDEITALLQQHADTLSQDLIKTVTTILTCANKSKISYNPFLTIIDYSQPSSNRRLWVFDLVGKQLRHHTYVSHGIRSGLVVPDYFSDTRNSRASSLGVFTTDVTYNGRYGLGIRLTGLEEGFNGNAAKRSIVIHPVWYVTETFINKYGRLGRSWGCPAVPIAEIESIIDSIKNRTLLIVYYPSHQWLAKSNFLTCESIKLANQLAQTKALRKKPAKESRDAILYTDNNKNNKREEHEPILVMPADQYMLAFNTRAPLSRMLRRQFNNKEYIALNHSELKQLDTNIDNVVNEQDTSHAFVDYVIPVVTKMEGGYYKTEFESVNIGQAKEIQLNGGKPVLKTPNKDTRVKGTSKFIRWLGL